MPPVNGPTQQSDRFWRSLDDLAQTDEFRSLLGKEFADYDPDEIVSLPTRRSFVKLMGGSMALAGVAGFSTGCRRWPENELAPYNERPEGTAPGVPQQYATMWELGGTAIPLLVSSFDGRPTKIEGNPTHPASGGASGAFTQATVLDMYDPSRSRIPLHNGEPATWDAFIEALRGINSSGLAILAEPTSSPTIQRLIAEQLPQALPGATWYEWDPINRDNELAATQSAFGQAVRPHLHLDKAEVIVTLDADFLSDHPDALRHARGWASKRRSADQGSMSRFWAIDSGFTVTSSNADERLPIRDSQMADVAKALQQAVAGTVSSDSPLSQTAKTFIQNAADDLKAHRGSGLVVAGADQPAAVQALCFAINSTLGNIGNTITFTQNPSASGTQASQISNLVQAINSGQVKNLIIIGGNPVYDAPADLNFADALASLDSTAHLSQYVNETSAACEWHLPQSHFLECWADGRSWDGTISIQQPLILPLYQSRSNIEFVATLLGNDRPNGQELVRDTYRSIFPADAFERGWRKTLHDGFVTSGFEAVTPTLGNFPQPASNASAGIEVVLRSDYSVRDGRFANNAWLQELPDPLTKLTWDNAALINPNTARQLGAKQGQLLSISAGGRSIQAPVFIMPGQAESVITIALGYGRTQAGEIGNSVGFNAYPLRTTGSMRLTRNAVVSALADSYTLATTQDHHAIDKAGLEEIQSRVFGNKYSKFGNIVRTVDLETYTRDLNAADAPAADSAESEEHGGGHHDDPTNYKAPLHVPLQPGTHMPLQVIGQFEYEGHKWGMSIDLASCIGCGGCVVACQAENNIPVVGKQGVIRGREMHWLRIDRYFSGVTDNPVAVHQPLTCHQCENAPCEQVCPVAATVHDTEGINVMVYNRCIGTRYCSNNCPYKVRRYNWFDWHAKPPKGADYTGTFLGPPDQQQNTKIDKIRRMQFNPEVTVRMRGVMEKCTFCTQRIKAATIPAKNEWSRARANGESVPDDGWRVEEGAITTACQQACPTQAITFGDLNREGSAVSEHFHSHRAYELLKEMNVRARTRYLARVTNPAPGSTPAAAAEEGAH